MALTQAVEPEELAALAAIFGRAPAQHVTLAVDDPFLTGENQLLTSNGRRAEICYIMHRGRPDEGVLLQIKTFYPAGAFRLPTGGIHVGEGVLDTLQREIYEETGLTVGAGSAQVKVERFLGVLSYALQHAGLGRTLPFATYHFLVQMPPDAVIDPQDAEESIGGWMWRTPAELTAVADILDAVHQRQPVWGDWGHFRAISQRFVAAALHA